MDGPLPLPYADGGGFSGKYTEITTKTGDRDVVDVDVVDQSFEIPIKSEPSSSSITTTNANSRDNNIKAKVRRTVLAAIGDPLPLDYLTGDGTNERESEREDISHSNTSISNDDVNNEQEVIKVKKHIRIADLGDPLPLPYTSTGDSIRSMSEGEGPITAPPAPIEESTIQKGNLLSKPFTRRAISMYDFGSPLPLKYVNQEINTERYLKRNYAEKEDVIHHQKEQNDVSHEQRAVDVTRRSVRINSGVDVLDVEREHVQEQEQEQPDVDVSADESEAEADTEKEENMSMNQTEILQLLHDRDYTTLEYRLKNADFRLQLLRYARELRRQHDFLCKVLHGEEAEGYMTSDNDGDEEVEKIEVNSVSETATASVRSQLRPAAVGALVFVALCCLSYVLAD